MNFDRDWTPFALDAEVEHFGTLRIAKAHNELRRKYERLKQENEALKSDLSAAHIDARERAIEDFNDWLEDGYR